MIQLTQEEVWTFNILEGSAKNAQAELQRMIAARDSYIGLLEAKYNAIFDRKTGTLEPKVGKKSNA